MPLRQGIWRPRCHPCPLWPLSTDHFSFSHSVSPLRSMGPCLWPGVSGVAQCERPQCSSVFLAVSGLVGGGAGEAPETEERDFLTFSFLPYGLESPTPCIASASCSVRPETLTGFLVRIGRIGGEAQGHRQQQRAVRRGGSSRSWGGGPQSKVRQLGGTAFFLCLWGRGAVPANTAAGASSQNPHLPEEPAWSLLFPAPGAMPHG